MTASIDEVSATTCGSSQKMRSTHWQRRKGCCTSPLCRTSIGVIAIALVMTPAQFFITVLANKYAPVIGVDQRTDTLLTPSNHAVRVGGALVDVKSVDMRQRRLKTIDGSELVKYAYVDRGECLRLEETGRRAGIISGSAQVHLGDGRSVFGSGSLVTQSRGDGQSIFTFHGSGGTGGESGTASVMVPDAHLDCEVFFPPPPGARRLTAHDVAESRRRHLLEVQNASALEYDHLLPHPACLVTHCFANEADCVDPAPKEACLLWGVDDQGQPHCTKPLCKMALEDFNPHQRALARQNDRWTPCFSRESTVACRRVVGGRGSVAQAYDECFGAARPSLRGATGVAVSMSALTAGDEVLAASSDGGLFFDRVVLNLHKNDESTASPMLRLHHAHGSITLTPGHMLTLDGVEAPARDAKVGSVLTTAHGGHAHVQHITRATHGIINPVTMSGRVLAADAGGVPVRATTVDESFAQGLTSKRNIVVTGGLPFFSVTAYLFPSEMEPVANSFLDAVGTENWPVVWLADCFITPLLLLAWTVRLASPLAAAVGAVALSVSTF